MRYFRLNQMGRYRGITDAEFFAWCCVILSRVSSDTALFFFIETSFPIKKRKQNAPRDAHRHERKIKALGGRKNGNF